MNLIHIAEQLIDLRDHDADVFGQNTDGQDVISLRNRLAHDYGSVDVEKVFHFVTGHLIVLLEEATTLRGRFVDEHKVQLD